MRATPPRGASARRRPLRSGRRAPGRPGAASSRSRSSSSGHGRLQHLRAGSTRSVRSYSRWKPCAAGDRRARRGSRAARASPSPASSSTSRRRPGPRSGATRSGPRSRISARISSARCGCVRARRRRTSGGRRVASPARKSGQSSTGIRHASCAQYSKMRPCAEEPRDRRRAGSRPRASASAMRWLRSTVEIESSWTHESRRIASSTSAARARRYREP